MQAKLYDDWQYARDSILSPLAVKHTEGLGRAEQDNEYRDRLRFEVDASRIQFRTDAFKRLAGKQQVFRAGTHELVQTRQSHTVRVATMSESMCNKFGLNGELGRAIGFAHDLGHAPFGHAGQDALNECIPFEHNQQSYQIVTRLEPQNLNQEVLDGILKHNQVQPGSRLARGHNLEAQLTNLADAVTYRAHDTEDALTMGILEEDDLKKTALGQLALKHGKGIWRGIIQLQQDDIAHQYPLLIAKHQLQTLADVYACTQTVMCFSPNMQAMLEEYDTFMDDNVYKHTSVYEGSMQGAQCLKDLFKHLKNNPTPEVEVLIRRFDYTVEEALRDYLSSLTDAGALTLHRKLRLQ